MTHDDFQTARALMVEQQLKTRGLKSNRVLEAMNNVPRHLFVLEEHQRHAYNDSPLPIGLGQTISQPYIVAYMTEQLEPAAGMKILEIGTGSGYQNKEKRFDLKKRPASGCFCSHENCLIS